MIIVALGSNLPSKNGNSQKNLEVAVKRMADLGLDIVAVSRWYETEPVPKSDQPNFINGVVLIQTNKTASQILAVLHQIEYEFGRRRTIANAARCIDLDLIDYHGECHKADNDSNLVLPHPRMQDRGFVLYPMMDVAPKWKHPVSGATLVDLISLLPQEQKIDMEPLI